jgi:hypothetical protein
MYMMAQTRITSVWLAFWNYLAHTTFPDITLVHSNVWFTWYCRMASMRRLLAKIWNAIINDCSAYKAHTPQLQVGSMMTENNRGTNLWHISVQGRSIHSSLALQSVNSSWEVNLRGEGVSFMCLDRWRVSQNDLMNLCRSIVTSPSCFPKPIALENARNLTPGTGHM